MTIGACPIIEVFNIHSDNIVMYQFAFREADGFPAQTLYTCACAQYKYVF